MGHSPALSAGVKRVEVSSNLIYCSSVGVKKCCIWCKKKKVWLLRLLLLRGDRDDNNNNNNKWDRRVLLQAWEEGGSKGEHMLEKC